MTPEQIKKGNEILENLKSLNIAKEKWNDTISCLGISCNFGVNGSKWNNSTTVDYSPQQAFDVFKLLTLENINKQITELETEFTNL